jgi:hypothetical protein
MRPSLLLQSILAYEIGNLLEQTLAVSAQGFTSDH